MSSSLPVLLADSERWTRANRRRARLAARRKRVARIGITALAACIGASAAALGLIALVGGAEDVASAASKGSAGEEAPALSPPPPGNIVGAEPLATPQTTLPPYQSWPVHLPGLTVDGWLITPGLKPGEKGQAVVSVPADKAVLHATQRFTLGERSWWVIERREIPADPDSWAKAMAANPIVPTVLLVSDLPINPRPAVVAR